MENDTFLAVSPIFRTENTKATLGQDAFGVLYNGPAVEESSTLLFSVTEDKAEATKSASVSTLKDTSRTFANAPVFHAGDYGVSPDSPDNSQALQTAFDAAAPVGGTVFIPEGLYRFGSIITVPESVRLVGAGSKGKYSTVLSFELQKNTEYSLVELQRNASVEDLEVRQGSILPGSVNTYAVSSMFPGVRILRVTVTAGRGVWLTTSEQATVEHLTANVTQIGVYLQEMKNVTLREITVTDPSGSYGTTGLRMEDSSAILSGLRGDHLFVGVDLLGNTDLQATLVTLKGPSLALSGNHTGNALITASGFSEAGMGGQTIFLENSQAMTGTVTVQGLIATGTSILGNLVRAENGKTEIRAAILTTPFATTLTTSGTAEIAVYGSIWDTYPNLHAAAASGKITLEGNLLRSDKTFEGIEGNYMLTSAGETGAVTDGINVIQHVYVYVETEDTPSDQPPQE